MKAREGPLELDKNLGKTMVVQNPGGRGPGQPGFYCETCNRTYKDTIGYLDHLNSRARKHGVNLTQNQNPLLTSPVLLILIHRHLRSTSTWSDDRN